MSKLSIFLLLLVILSALAVVTVRDESRHRYMELNEARQGEYLLDDDYSRLKLLQAKLSSHQLIQQAAEQQNLRSPSLAETRMININK